jgi:REP element-mobilizing transposase RayT
MGHIRRLQVAGTYHVTTRSIDEERIFRSDADYVDFLTLLAPLTWTCHAFCVMPTHYHALATVDSNELSALMHRLNRRYATRFNRRNARRGRVFDGPYASVYVDSQSHLLWLARYIAQNPSRPKEWRWSSFTSDYSFVDATLLERSFGSREYMLRFALDS